jgi:hypothetical protein
MLWSKEEQGQNGRDAAHGLEYSVGKVVGFVSG